MVLHWKHTYINKRKPSLKLLQTTESPQLEVGNSPQFWKKLICPSLRVMTLLIEMHVTLVAFGMVEKVSIETGTQWFQKTMPVRRRRGGNVRC